MRKLQLETRAELVMFALANGLIGPDAGRGFELPIMSEVRAWFRDRVHKKALHGSKHIAKQRRTALLLVITAFMRVAVWLLLIALYLAGVGFTKSLFASVAFVAVISLYANAATDFGQGCSSLAQLAATDAHHDAEQTRQAVGVDFQKLDTAITRLAALQPGPEAAEQLEEIRAHLRHRTNGSAKGTEDPIGPRREA
jgi:hypothetical protein